MMTNRRVRTLAGAAYFNKPIGEPIVSIGNKKVIDQILGRVPTDAEAAQPQQQQTSVVDNFFESIVTPVKPAQEEVKEEEPVVGEAQELVEEEPTPRISAEDERYAARLEKNFNPKIHRNPELVETTLLKLRTSGRASLTNAERKVLYSIMRTGY